MKALIDKARRNVLDEAGVTMKFRLFFDVISPDYVEGDEQRHVAHLARLVSKLKRPDSGAELFLDWVKSRVG